VLATEPFVGLRGLDPGLELFVPTDKTLTADPFSSNICSAGCSLTRSSIRGC